LFLFSSKFGAGSDTTADAIETFIFACAANPDKVAKAHEELDRVIGRERLPEFSDEDGLVYCGAMVRELLRWRTVIPGGKSWPPTEN
jgi:cytochrome P450